MTPSINTQFAAVVYVLTCLARICYDRPDDSEELSKRAVPGSSVRVPGIHGGCEPALDASQISLGQVLLLQGNDPVLGLHGPEPTCRTGRSVQKSLVVLGQEVAGAIAASMRQALVNTCWQTCVAAKVPCLGTDGMDTQ